MFRPRLFLSQVMRSSAFEGMLLRATWPGNEAVPMDILTEIIKHSIPAFKYGRAVRSFLRRWLCNVLRPFLRLCKRLLVLTIVHCIVPISIF